MFEFLTAAKAFYHNCDKQIHFGLQSVLRLRTERIVLMKLGQGLRAVLQVKPGLRFECGHRYPGPYSECRTSGEVPNTRKNAKGMGRVIGRDRHRRII